MKTKSVVWKMTKSIGGELLFFTILFSLLASLSLSQLVINVKNEGEELTKESIISDTTQDIVTLTFQKPDGTLVTMIIDFKAEVQIFRVVVLGEVEIGQTQYDVMCFVTRFVKSEFISSDAMAKLRQKNPGTIRNPEEDKGRETLLMDLSIDLSKSSRISRHIYNFCSEAKENIFSRESDFKHWAKGNNHTLSSLMSGARRVASVQTAPCGLTEAGWWNPCTCSMEIRIGWYPCGLKYCRGRDSVGKVVSYRCGIKTCRKCRSFEYYVKQKHQCVWDKF